MSQLHFPVRPEGLIVPVLVGLGGKETKTLHLAGQAIPPPQSVTGLLDTGSDVTVVSVQVLQALGVTSSTSTTTTTVAGKLPVRIFEVSISITDPTQSATAWLTVPDLLVMEAPSPLRFGDVLIGLDILLLCQLELDGPGGRFVLGF
jgi:hypothetical protein